MKTTQVEVLKGYSTCWSILVVEETSKHPPDCPQAELVAISFRAMGTGL